MLEELMRHMTFTLNLNLANNRIQVLNKEINPEDLVQAKVIRYPHLIV